MIRKQAASATIILILTLTASLSAAEYRTITQDEIINISYDPRGDPERLINIAEDHNTSYDEAWEAFANHTEVTITDTSWHELCNGPDETDINSSNSEFDSVTKYLSTIKYDSAWKTEGNASARYVGAHINAHGFLSMSDHPTNHTGTLSFSLISNDMHRAAFVINLGTGYINDSTCELRLDEDDLTLQASYDDIYFDTIELSNNTQHDFQIIPDYDNSTYQLRVDNQEIAVNGTTNPPIPQNIPATNFNMIQWRFYDFVNAWLDEIMISNYTEASIIEGGRYIGAALPESRARHNLTGSSFTVGSLMTVTASDIGSCASEVWVRSPIAYQSGTRLIVQVYAVTGSALINATSIDENGITLLPVNNPREVWNWNYSLTYTTTTYNIRNRTFAKICAPLYPNQQYFVSFTVTGVTETHIDAYWTQCDLWSDGRYRSVIYLGSGDPIWIPIDPGVSVLVTKTAGAGISGKQLTEPAGSLFAMNWDAELNATVENGSYLTFTMPFTIDDSETDTSASVSIAAYNATGGVVWEIYETVDDSTNFILISDQVTYDPNATYETITIAVTFDGSAPAAIWIQDKNSRITTDAPTTTVTSPYSEEWRWTPVYSLQITDGILDLYERPWMSVEVYYRPAEKAAPPNFSPLDIFLLGLDLYARITIEAYTRAYDTAIDAGQELWALVKEGLEWVYDRIVEALGTAGAFLWDHAGVYIYAAVSIVVNAFVDATVTLVNIILVVAPLVIFASIVNFWAKFLRSFRVWYTEGYDAYATYLEREMMHILTVGAKAVMAIKNPKALLRSVKTAAQKEYGSLTGKSTAAKERAIVKRTTKIIKDTASTTVKRAKRAKGKRQARSRPETTEKEPPKKRSNAERRFKEQFGPVTEIDEFEWSAEEEEKERLDKEYGKKRELPS